MTRNSQVPECDDESNLPLALPIAGFRDLHGAESTRDPANKLDGTDVSVSFTGCA